MHARREERIFHPGEKPKKDYPENSVFLKVLSLNI